MTPPAPKFITPSLDAHKRALTLVTTSLITGDHFEQRFLTKFNLMASVMCSFGTLASLLGIHTCAYRQSAQHERYVQVGGSRLTVRVGRLDCSGSSIYTSRRFHEQMNNEIRHVNSSPIQLTG